MGYQREKCGNCKYNRHSNDGNNGMMRGSFYCGNEDADMYGVPTFYDDVCDDYEEKEERRDKRWYE